MILKTTRDVYIPRVVVAASVTGADTSSDESASTQRYVAVAGSAKPVEHPAVTQCYTDRLKCDVCEPDAAAYLCFLVASSWTEGLQRRSNGTQLVLARAVDGTGPAFSWRTGVIRVWWRAPALWWAFLLLLHRLGKALR